MLGSLLCLPGSGSVLLDPCTGSTISETTSEAWSVEVLPSDSGQNWAVFASFFSMILRLFQRHRMQSNGLFLFLQDITVLGLRVFVNTSRIKRTKCSKGERRWKALGKTSIT